MRLRDKRQINLGQRHSNDFRASAIVSRLERDLSLSKSQIQRVKVIVSERFDVLKVPSSDKTTQLNDASSAASRKLNEVLASTQYALYVQLRTETQKQKNEFLERNPDYKFTDQEREMDF